MMGREAKIQERVPTPDVSLRNNRHYLLGLPPALEPLAATIAELAIDLRWTWSHAGDSLWKTLDPGIWEQTENPFVVLQNVTRARLEELGRDTRFKQLLEQLSCSHREYCADPGWYGTNYPDADLKGVAYFSMEFGLGNALPLYAGGLGVLAGDYLKAASDLGMPVVGIGLLYQEGYFRQVLDMDGRQQEIYSYNDSAVLPVQPVSARSGAWMHIPLELPGRTVRFRVWQARVGRVQLYLLDSNDPLNSPLDRGITSRLYGGNQESRLVQEVALGICGWRLVEALDLDIDICHLNEGHAAFVTLERARCFMQKHHIGYWEALWATRAGNIFTTHTPVPSGFDTYDPDLLAKYGADYASSLNVEPEALAGLGRKNPHDLTEPFNMAYLAIRASGMTNGVSRLHGDVSRRIFRDLYPRWPLLEVPITHITNGIHVPSWDSQWADDIWTRSCGKERWLGTLDTMSEAIEALDDETLWAFRGEERSDLVRHARNRLARQLAQRGADVNMIADAHDILDPNVLTLGFARRFAEYKRPNLLLQDQDRLTRLLTNCDRPVQLIIAGKAHPNDETGKRFVQQWARFVQRPEVRLRAVFLEDYDIALAQELVQGVDVWINTPRRPWEACGTSGMKVLANGGLNLSELDGWWAEACSDDVGWSLGDGQEHSGRDWDVIEAEQLYRLLENEIVPEFYDRDSTGVPGAWVARMRLSMARLALQYSSNRMIRDYLTELYLPSASAHRRRIESGGRLAIELRQWELTLKHHWNEIHWGNLEVSEQHQGWCFSIQVYLGELAPELVQVQLFAEANGQQDTYCEVMQQTSQILGATNAYVYQCVAPTTRPHEDYTARVVPYHAQARVPTELSLIQWQR